MSWLTDFVRPKIRRLVRKSDVPENLWHKCPQCEHMLFHRDFQENGKVCHHCQYHFPLTARERLDLLLDPHSYQLMTWKDVPHDPLRFRDNKRYVDRLKDMRSKTSQDDAFLLARGTICSHPVTMGVFDFRFIGGSMGLAVGEGILRGAEIAVESRSPYVLIPASGGARMQEGIFSLMQMPRSILAIKAMKEHRLPYCVILTNPTTGGVSASFASLGDITFAEPGAIIGFTGRRVIEETLRTPLPHGFQSSEFQFEHGFLDGVVHRYELKTHLSRVLGLLAHKLPLSSSILQKI